MSANRKLLRMFHCENIVVKVYKEYDWNEFVARLFIGGKEREEASYHCDDRAECIATGEFMFCHALKRAKG